jgi:hypothetical protein|tara:strand:- start:2948 stop:4000 length:1053 start_codon:yes stop_codon:yes gene_type:complete
MNLHLMAPVGYTGYGYASMNILQNLYEDHSVGLTTIGNPNPENQDQSNIISQCNNLTSMIPYDSPCIKIWHQFDLLNRVGSGKYLAFPFFEVDKFNQKEIYHLNFADEIIVSCEWATQVLEDNGINKTTHIVPMGVDTSVFNHEQSNETNNYVFMTVGKWEKRKAHDTIIECFNRAFEENDQVELWLVTHNPFLNKEEEAQWLNLVEKSKLRKKIRVFPRLQTHAQLSELMSYSNCGVYISRGEGWNLELLETMAMNKPVIASNFTAHTEYCNADNSFLVDIQEKELALDNKWFFGHSQWAKIGQSQIDQTVDYMRHCYKNSVKTNEKGLETAQNLSWKNTCDRLVGCMT